MGTNFYRLPKQEEFEAIKQQMIQEIQKASDLQLAKHHHNLFNEIVNYDWQDEQGNNLIVHLGKRSAGWKFHWNFHRNKFYSNKEELFSFIRSGRVFDEYGEEQNPEEFIQMALNWCPNGHDSYNPAPCYDFNTGKLIPTTHTRNHDIYIDGLRVDSPESHSTYFS